LQNVAAVEKGGVYVFTTNIWCSPRYLIGIAYYARWFHPELFEDLDPKAIHQEYLTRFQGLDIDLDKKGVFVYHPGGH
jgi:iron complex transport system substrate-binding protein